MEPLTIVALGLAEGGIESLQTFFDHTPLDHTAYVILCHLTPGKRSELQAILKKHSLMQIVEAVNAEKLMSNVVYVLTKDTSLRIVKNRLIVGAWPTGQQDSTIDLFLTSLSKNKQSKIAAVILSGNGSDGAVGIAAVKKARGLVICQNPASAAKPEMPASAMATGMVDFSILPAHMPDLLMRWTENKLLPVPFNISLSAYSAHQELILLQLGAAIKNKRQQQKISQFHFAKQAGMQKASMSRVESGKTNITILSLRRMAFALGIDIGDFF